MRRRIIPAAAALLFASAAPASAECVNLSQDRAASSFSSSTHASGLYPAQGVIDGRESSGASKGYWNDDTPGSWPDYVGVWWRDGARPIGRIVVKAPIAQAGFPVGEITLASVRVQYLDPAAASWVDVVGASDQPNPIANWTGAIGRADGNERRQFDLPTPVTTDSIRVLVEDGSSDGWSWLDEIEAYAPDCEEPNDVNVAQRDYGGRPVASSNGRGWGAWGLNDTDRSNDWRDDTQWTFPDWAGIDWSTPQTINRIVVRGPVFPDWVFPPSENWHTLASTRIQYWDDGVAAWVDVVGARGQPNAIVDWELPLDLPDGSETKQFDLPRAITTTRIRALFEDGTSEGWSYLEEIEAYLIS